MFAIAHFSCCSPVPIRTFFLFSNPFVYSAEAKKMLPDSRLGGVFLTGFGGRLTCDNTLEARLNLIYEEEKPTVRQTLFGVA